MKTELPITTSIERLATDSTGCVTRMEPIWEGLEMLEREVVRLREAVTDALAHLETNYDIDGNSMAKSDAANKLRSILANVRDDRQLPGHQTPELTQDLNG
jgi:hypothetical protein